MNILGTSIIAGERALPAKGTLSATNPATGETLEPCFYFASASDVQRAAEKAAEAFPVFAGLPGKKRAAFLRRIADLIAENAAPLAERAGLETGLPAARLQGEIGRTTGQLRLFAAVLEEGSWVDARIDRADPERKPLPKPDVRSMLQPIGPVAVFSASNFPFAFSVAGGDTASAFAAGCPVIVKAHSAHPGTSELVGQLVTQAVADEGLPAGTFSLILGSGQEVGTALVKHPSIKAVGFTGSTAGGRSLMDVAAARPEPIPVYAEMGSINPVFLLPGALEERAEAIATGLHGSLTLGVGQFCTNPGLVFVVESSPVKSFLNKLAELVRATPPGTMLSPGICKAYAGSVAAARKVAGVECLAEAAPVGGPASAGCAALLTTTFENFKAQPELMNEMFGPATLVVRCTDRKQMLEAASLVHGQLTATIHAAAGELETSKDGLLDAIAAKAGRLVYNAFPTGVEVCHAMTHGGPYPATADGRSTSVGTRAIFRFVRPVCYQDMPDACLPEALQEANPLGIRRMVDGKV